MIPNNFYAVDENGNQYGFDKLNIDNSILLTLKKETIVKCKQIRILSELGRAKAGEDGYWILPRNLNMIGDIQTFFTEKADCSQVYGNPIMSWYGIKKKDFCCIVRVERNYKYKFEASVKDNVYTVTPLFDFTANDKVYDDIRVEIVVLPSDSDYNDMARAEREIRLKRGEIRTLKEKCATPAVEYARKYPLIRIRMGWKPSPSPVFHQTEENEPDMFVACDFKRVQDIANELKRQGVEGAELQLVGWNRSGHDGRFPQLFPADKRLGGNEGLKETIEHVKKLGYRISTHTNTIDAYEIADTFTWDDIVVNRNGEYEQNGHYSGGYAYHVCLEKQWKNTLRDLPKLASFGENGVHFTDVISIVVPDDCHAPSHPSSTANGIIYAQKIINYTNGLFGGFSSEGCMDFAMKYLDYALYTTFGYAFGKTERPLASRFLPIFEITYHGTLLYNPSSATVNFTAQPPKDHLEFIMRGGKPSMYFYSKFRTGNALNWMGENDLTCASNEALCWSVSKIKEALNEYAPLADKQLLYIARYDVLGDGIEVCTYEDGSRIVGNFSNKHVVFEGKEIAPYGYIEISL